VAFQQEVDPDDWVDTESRFLFPMNTLPKLLHLALPLLLFVSSCNEECRPAVLSEVDEVRSCALPVAEVPELQFCHRAGATRTKGITPICVSGPGGKRYAGYIATDEHISGEGFEILNNCNAGPLIDGDGGCQP
jgi:hypothetical protein